MLWEALALEESTSETLVPQVKEMLGPIGASLGAIRAEVDGASPWPGDDAGVHFGTW
jgi:hypothetical protein